MKTLLLLFVSALSLAAQTSVSFDKVKAPADTAPRMYVFLPSGQAVVAVLDSQMVLDMTVTPFVLRVVLPTPPATVLREQIDVTKATGPMTGLSCSQTPISEPDVSVGGLMYSPGEDYTRSGRQITLKTPAQSGDVIRIKYHF
jgi:hypothetical protein